MQVIEMASELWSPLRYLDSKRWRKCVKGRYALELMTPEDRRIDCAITLRQRLGQVSGGIVAPFPAKPKWMRWR